MTDAPLGLEGLAALTVVEVDGSARTVTSDDDDEQRVEGRERSAVVECARGR